MLGILTIPYFDQWSAHEDAIGDFYFSLFTGFIQEGGPWWGQWLDHPLYY